MELRGLCGLDGARVRVLSVVNACDMSTGGGVLGGDGGGILSSAGGVVG